MRRVARYVMALSAVAVALTVAACGGSSAPASDSASGGAHVVRVPQDATTISAAVKRAHPGDVVLVAAGTYRETVQIDTPHVTLRGLDRNRVIIDGQVLRPNGVVLTGDGDAVQNLTVRNATLNGVLVTGETDGDGAGIGKGSDGYSVHDASKFPPVRGFLVDHVTSYDNGLYGVYVFDAVRGEIRDSYTSGMADSGFYVGQCKPCAVAVHGNVAERNAVGYEGTNASGAVSVYGNRFAGNRVGATTDSDHQEAFLPQSGAVLAGNVIAANNAATSPEQADGGFGIGLGIAGGTNNVVTKNLVQANRAAGAVITNYDDLAPSDNRLIGNVFGTNGVDVAYIAAGAAAGSGNCLQDNELTTVRPATFPRSCPAAGSRIAGATLPGVVPPPGVPFTQVPKPPAQPGLTDPTGSPAPTVAAPTAVDPATVPVPTAALLQDHSVTRW